MTLTELLVGRTSQNPQDLFEEAHRRRRRRRGVAGAAVVAVALTASLVVSVFVGGGSGATVVPTAAPKFATVVTDATRAAGSARILVTVRRSQPGCPWSQTVSTGWVDFAGHRMETTTVSAHSAYDLCTDPTGGHVRQTGDVVYASVPVSRCRPAGCHLTVSSSAPRPGSWIRYVGSDALSGVSPGDGAGVVVSPYGLTLLRAIPGAVHRVGPTDVNGSAATEYSATMSLADLQNAVRAGRGQAYDALSGALTPAQGIPSSSAIPIQVHVWVDAKGRVVRVTARQPSYMINFVGGASSGADQFPPGYFEPSAVPSDRPYQQGYVQVTVDYSGFGTPHQMVFPPAGQVTSAR